MGGGEFGNGCGMLSYRITITICSRHHEGSWGRVNVGKAVANNEVYGMVCNPLCVEPSASATPGGRPRVTAGNGG